MLRSSSPVKDTALSRLGLGFKSRPEHTNKRFESFPHQLYKGDKIQGILTNMPSYLSNGVKQVKMAEHVIEALSEPNRQYSKDFESYMQVLNRNPRTIWRRLYEIAWLLEHLDKDAKQATKDT